MNIYDLADKLTFLSPLGLIVGIIGGIYRYSSLSKVYRLITVYLIIAFATDLISRLMSAMEQSNLLLLPVFNLLELLLFIRIYYLFFEKNRKLVLAIVAGVVLSAVCTDLPIAITDPNAVNYSCSSITESLSIVFLAFLFFFDRIRGYNEMKWPVFVLNSVILVYFSVKLIFYIPIDFFINASTDLKFYFWILHVAMLIFFYLFLANSIWKNGNIRQR